MKRLLRPLGLPLALAFAAMPAAAQLPTDEPVRERTVPLREEVQRELESARFRVGPLRLLPKFVVRDLGYNNNAFGADDGGRGDTTGTLGFGVRYVVPMGAKLFLRGDAVPEYTWYRELSERRFLGGTYRGSLLALFNRMSLEAAGSYTRQQGALNIESLVPVNSRATDAKIGLDVDVLDRLSVVGGAVLRRTRLEDVPEAGVSSSDLDRDDRAFRAGLRYAFRDWFHLSATVERTESSFESQATIRDNATTAYLLGVRFDQRRFYVEVTGGVRYGRPKNESLFPRYSEPIGSIFVSWLPARTLEIQLSGARRPVNNLTSTEPYFIDTRVRARIGVALGRRFVVAGFGERGRTEFSASTAGDEGRGRARGTISGYGGTVGFRIGGNVRLDLNGGKSRYERRADGSVRTIASFSLGLTYEMDMARYDKR